MSRLGEILGEILLDVAEIAQWALGWALILGIGWILLQVFSS